MLNLPQKTLQTIKKYLLKEQTEVEKNLEELKKDDPALTPSLAESSEPGTDSWIADAHTRTLALGQQLRVLAGSIRAALGRMRNGTYGICERCNKHIEIKRLMILPQATLCLSCSKKKVK